MSPKSLENSSLEGRERGMGVESQTQTQTSPHLYPQSLQLKLYQAFIFSVPILFSIILFLLFYLFYLKRRRDSTLPSSSSPIPSTTTLHQPTTSLDPPLAFEVDLKEDLKEKLPVIMFDEALRTKDSQCCVCLGDYELEEKLHQIPACKHLFHIECIHHWLQANLTCPLCRCRILPMKKLKTEPPVRLEQVLSSDQEHIGEVGDREESSQHLDAQTDSSVQHSVVIMIDHDEAVQ